jgi:DNA-binding transcriptional regulator YdaS (Cro superfamily)
MQGLSFILGLYDCSNSELARKLGVTRQTVNDWVGKRKKSIPEKRLQQLSRMFHGINKEYFEKDLTEEEKVHIKLNKAKHESINLSDDFLTLILEKGVNGRVASQLLEEGKEERKERMIKKISEVENIVKEGDEKKINLLNVVSYLLSDYTNKNELGAGIDYIEASRNKKLLEDIGEVLLRHKIIEDEFLMKIYTIKGNLKTWVHLIDSMDGEKEIFNMLRDNSVESMTMELESIDYKQITLSQIEVKAEDNQSDEIYGFWSGSVEFEASIEMSFLASTWEEAISMAETYFSGDGWVLEKAHVFMESGEMIELDIEGTEIQWIHNN